ncbi:selenium binding protein [Virgibacillus pantothenticus]|uniref:Selenium binding protein n=2 Tax=Virgibacillus pantothenticus TaxID=1473 RepID=A0A0L0QM35_VIRPA|nr:selenium binding protein [Virgibacillus pantothenticus]QTY18536.1 selenium binding protein [Virgibacillus pantothenticus]
MFDERYSCQALPSRKYRELLGSAICVFNSNNAFIIENILTNDGKDEYNWYQLIDRTSGKLLEPVKNTITKNSDTIIAKKFNEIIEIRNRIMHSYQVTAPRGSGLSDDEDNQILATKYKNGKQAYITQEFLYDFIKKNAELSNELHNFRGH